MSTYMLSAKEVEKIVAGYSQPGRIPYKGNTPLDPAWERQIDNAMYRARVEGFKVTCNDTAKGLQKQKEFFENLSI